MEINAALFRNVILNLWPLIDILGMPNHIVRNNIKSFASAIPLVTSSINRHVMIFKLLCCELQTQKQISDTFHAYLFKPGYSSYRGSSIPFVVAGKHIMRWESFLMWWQSISRAASPNSIVGIKSTWVTATNWQYCPDAGEHGSTHRVDVLEFSLIVYK